MYRKNCQVTYITKLLEFFGGKTLHKLPNYQNYRGFNFWEKPKVAHIEPYLLPFAQPAKLDRSVGGEGEVGEGAKVDEEVGKEEEEHGWRREDGGVHF